MFERCLAMSSADTSSAFFPARKRFAAALPLLAGIALVLSGCGSTQTVAVQQDSWAYNPPSAIDPAPLPVRPKTVAATTYSGHFVKPGELEPAVEFWRNVYVKWGRSDVVIHDDRFLDVVYEVMPLPGYADDKLSLEQKELVSQRRNFWKSRLAVLENKRRYNIPLNPEDRELIARLERSGRALDEILQGAAERVHTQRGTRERFKRGLEISTRYDRQFRRIFRNAGLPEDLAFLPHVESSFQPGARSSAGAVGMWQFTRSAAKRFMPSARHRDLRLDPMASAVGAANYLTYAYSKLGNWPAAITSYNHGIAGMKRAQNTYGNDFARIVQSYSSPAFGFASRNYYAQFLAAREIASNPGRYFNDLGVYVENGGKPADAAVAQE